jgi:hypothetical protein
VTTSPVLNPFVLGIKISILERQSSAFLTVCASECVFSQRLLLIAFRTVFIAREKRLSAAAAAAVNRWPFNYTWYRFCTHVRPKFPIEINMYGSSEFRWYKIYTKLSEIYPMICGARNFVRTRHKLELWLFHYAYGKSRNRTIYSARTVCQNVKRTSRFTFSASVRCSRRLIFSAAIFLMPFLFIPTLCPYRHTAYRICSWPGHWCP